jgi:hypothetical protein
MLIRLLIIADIVSIRKVYFCVQMYHEYVHGSVHRDIKYKCITVMFMDPCIVI